MKTLSEVVTLIGRVERTEIEAWVERAWVVPAERVPEPAFSELDIARISLICDLRRDVGVEDETVPLVLSLLDQLYATRRRMSALTEAIQRQPEEVRRAICQTMAGRPPDEGGVR
ncbi:MAG: chaperone modulator CbpM [Geminicoccaceae bacterium]|nr:chaperone modulator CbpM [Geminicoccaceae bacterium]